MGSFKDLRVLPNPWKIKADINKHHYFREYFQSSSQCHFANLQKTNIIPSISSISFYETTFTKNSPQFYTFSCQTLYVMRETEEMITYGPNGCWFNFYSLQFTVSKGLCQIHHRHEILPFDKKKERFAVIYLLLLTEIVYVHHYSDNSRFW